MLSELARDLGDPERFYQKFFKTPIDAVQVARQMREQADRAQAELLNRAIPGTGTGLPQPPTDAQIARVIDDIARVQRNAIKGCGALKMSLGITQLAQLARFAGHALAGSSYVPYGGVHTLLDVNGITLEWGNFPTELIVPHYDPPRLLASIPIKLPNLWATVGSIVGMPKTFAGIEQAVNYLLMIINSVRTNLFGIAEIDHDQLKKIAEIATAYNRGDKGKYNALTNNCQGFVNCVKDALQVGQAPAAIEELTQRITKGDYRTLLPSWRFPFETFGFRADAGLQERLYSHRAELWQMNFVINTLGELERWVQVYLRCLRECRISGDPDGVLQVFECQRDLLLSHYEPDDPHTPQCDQNVWARVAFQVAGQRMPEDQTPEEGISSLVLQRQLAALRSAPRVFATSHFRRHYSMYDGALHLPPIERASQVYNLVSDFLFMYCQEHGLTSADDEYRRKRFCAALVQETSTHPEGCLELLGEVGATAELLWTSALTFEGMPPEHNKELCSLLNAAYRDDNPRLAPVVAGFARALNETLCITRGHPERLRAFPPNSQTYRGGGFDDTHRGFFTTGVTFRVPAFLATSFEEHVADTQMERHSGNGLSAVRWTIHFDPTGDPDHPSHVPARRPAHVNFVQHANVAPEREYLFAPYSVFSVRSATWNAGTLDSPHQIELDASPDSAYAAGDAYPDRAFAPRGTDHLPLAPWY